MTMSEEIIVAEISEEMYHNYQNSLQFRFVWTDEGLRNRPFYYCAENGRYYKRNFGVNEFVVWLAPFYPHGKGMYYAKTPVLEQAQGIVNKLKENEGLLAFIKCECSDGKTRYLEF